VEKELGLFDLYTADEVFVTGTAAEVAPVTKVDGRIIGEGKPGPITKELMAAFKELAMTTGTAIFK
jgi:branched-chain amino acid aminotransferase